MATPARSVGKDGGGLGGRDERLAELTVRHALPDASQFRRFVAAGGLMSYGSSETEYYHLMGPAPEKFSGVTSRPICRSTIGQTQAHDQSQDRYRSLADETIE